MVFAGPLCLAIGFRLRMPAGSSHASLALLKDRAVGASLDDPLTLSILLCAVLSSMSPN